MNNKKIITFFTEFENDFPKLVRNKIPKLIIKNEGKPAVTQVEKNKLNLINLIKKKIVEESMELFSYNKKEDIIYGVADIIETIEKLKHETNISIKEINYCRKVKNKIYGSFKKSIILISK